MSDLKLCYGCMEPLGSETVCAHCGYDLNTTSLANYLKPGTLLRERFLVGKVLEANGEGVTYIGYDTSVDCKILIREYFPERLCSRVPNSGAVNVKYDHLAQYKALMAEYTELNKALARLRNLSHLNPALDMFAENNTTYAVSEYLEGGTLLEYLKENAGELSWSIVRRIFPPLFTTLSLLHNAGVLHRGLSPETIFVTDKGELKLLGFSISAVRTNDTELDAELFDGYAAPEQYYADRQQGTWTDVYGICAVLYRILTGCRATDAISRQDYDILVPPSELNPHIPENVSEGIMQGLKLDSNARVRTITDLVTLLFDEDAPEQTESDETPAGIPSKEATAVFQAHRDRTGSQHTQHPQQHSGAQHHREPNAAARVAAAKAAAGAPGGARRPNGSRPAGSGNRSAANGNRPGSNGSRPGTRRPAGTGQNGQRRPAADHRTANGSRPNRSAAQQRQNPQNRRRPEQYHRPQPKRAADEVSVLERMRAPIIIAILFIAIISIVIAALVKVLNMNNPQTIEDSEESTTSSVVRPSVENENSNIHYDFEVPDLIGKNYQIKRNEMAGWLELEPEFEFNDTVLKDYIFWQEFEEGTDFVSGTSMKVKVSLGSSIITIPSFKNMRLQSYCKKLEEMGLSKAIDGGGNNNMAPGAQQPVNGTTPNQTPNAITTTTSKNGKVQNVIYKAIVNYNFNNGYVCAVEPDVGTPLDALDNYDIIVYYAYNPVYNTISNGSTGTTNRTTSNKNKTTTTKTTTTKTVQTDTAHSTERQQQQPVTQQPPVATEPPQQQQPPVSQQPTNPDPPVQQPTNPDPPVQQPPDNGGGDQPVLG